MTTGKFVRSGGTADGGWALRGRAGSVFRALAWWMTGLGLAVGVGFPFFVLTLHIPASTALRPGFFATTLSAGLLVGLVNYRMARLVVATRLRALIGRMNSVEHTLAEMASGGDWTNCDLDSFHLLVDSTDELGQVAGAFNRLVDAAALAHQVEQAAADLVTTVAGESGTDRLCEAALRRLLHHSRAPGGAVVVLRHGQIRTSAQHGLPEGLDLVNLAETTTTAATTETSGLHEMVHAGQTLLIAPVRCATADTGLVVLRGQSSVNATTRRLVILLVDSLRVAIDAARLQQELTYTATHDGLTGLISREQFVEVVQRMLLRSSIDRRPAILIVDIDDFKAVNDCLGHAAGDKLLVELGLRIQQHIRTQDTAARFGGDEFAVLLEDAGDHIEMTNTANRLLSQLSAPIQFGDRSISLTISIGAAAPAEGTTVQSLLRDANIAMYTAKREGKAQTRVFDPPLRARAARR